MPREKKEKALREKKEKVPREKKERKNKKSRIKKHGLQPNMVEAWNIQGIHCFIDSSFRIYKTEDIMKGLQNPSLVGSLSVSQLTQTQIEQKTATIKDVVYWDSPNRSLCV